MAGEIVNGLKVYMALAEDLSLDPSTHASHVTIALGESNASVGMCIHVYITNYIDIILKSFFLNKNAENIDEQQITCLAYARPLVVLTSNIVRAIRT